MKPHKTDDIRTQKLSEDKQRGEKSVSSSILKTKLPIGPIQSSKIGTQDGEEKIMGTQSKPYADIKL